MQWINYFVPSVSTPLTEGHAEAPVINARIQRIKEKQEAYHCLFDCSKEHLKLDEKRENKPTFKNYSGPHRPFLGLIFFDFDAEDVSLAHRDALKFLDTFGDYHLSFSGNKGFHIAVPEETLGLPHDENLAKTLSLLMGNLKRDYPTLDAGIHQEERKFRVLNSLHPKSQLYKVTVNKALTLSQIKELAQSKPTTYYPPNLPKEKNEKLLTYLTQIREQPKVSTQVKVKEKLEQDEVYKVFREAIGKKCIERLLEDRVETGSRHRTAHVIISDLYYTGKTQEQALRILSKAPLYSELEQERPGEILRLLSEYYSGQSQYSFGCGEPLKLVKCSAKCPVFKKLSAEIKPNPLDAPVTTNKAILPSEVEVAHRILKDYGPRLVREGHNLFEYKDTHWVELQENALLALKARIHKEYLGEADSRKVDSTLKTLRVFVSEAPTKMYNIPLNIANFLNGTLHLHTTDDGPKLKFLPHALSDGLVNVLPYEYDEHSTAKNQAFLDALERVFEGDEDKEEKIRAVGQMFGACLMPIRPHLFFLYGPPKTGKSTIMKLAYKFMHPKNVCHVEPTEMRGFLMESMLGKVMNLVTDVTINRPINDSIIKRIEDRIPTQINRKGLKAIEGYLPPLHIFGGNSIPPTLEGANKSHDRRWTFIQCKNVVAKGNYNKDFVDWAFNQSPEGILNFAISGLNDLIGSGGHYIQPKSGQEKMAQWQESNDPVSQILRALDENELEGAFKKLVRDPEGKVQRKIVWDIVSEYWQKASPYDRSIKKHSFFDALRERGFQEVVTEGVRYFRCISVKDDSGAEHKENGLTY